MPLSVVATPFMLGSEAISATFNTTTGALTVSGTGGFENTMHTFAFDDDANNTLYAFPNIFPAATGTFPTASFTPAGGLAPGNYKFSFAAITFAPTPGSREFSIPWTLAAPEITTLSLPGGFVGTSYSQTILGCLGTGFSPSAAHSIALGTLPPGLNYASTADGIAISGTPSQAGVFPFTVRFGNGHPDFTEEQVFAIVIAEPSAVLCNDASIVNLVTNPGSLVPGFDPTVFLYNVSVANNVTSIAFGVTTHPNASYTIAGPATLVVGQNTFNIIVTAEDGVTIEIYTVIVTRAAAGTPPISPPPSPPPSSTTSAPSTPRPTPTPIPPEPAEERISRFSAFTSESEDANIELSRIDVELPEGFVRDILQRDTLNALFLLEEMHSIEVLAGGEVTNDVLAIVQVYVGDLNLSDVQRLMLRGFVIDPETGGYTVIPGTFTADRNYFNFEFYGSGIIGGMFYELPVPLLRLTIGQYRYYNDGLPLTSDVAPFITQNRTMVPIRLVAEALGATPRWEDATRTAYIYYGNRVLRLLAGYPLPDGMGTPLMQNNRILVPLRFVIENFDAITLWDGARREVTVFTW